MIRICPDCARYTLDTACPECGGQAQDPSPPKFSPEDKYGSYRRRLKRMEESSDSTEEENA